MALQDHPMWRKPQHHQDAEGEHNHVHWVELFYDLIHVVTIFLLGNFLSHHLNLSGFLIFTVIFAALWFAWAEISVFNSIYISTDFWHRFIMASMVIDVMFIAAAIPTIEGGGWPYFAIGFAVNRFLIAFLYLRARRVGAETSSLTNIMIRQMVFFGILYLISAFLPRPAAYWFYLFSLIANQLAYVYRRTSAMQNNRFQPRMVHLSERFALLTLIVLGESFFKLVVTLSEKGIYKVGPDILLNFAFGGFSTFILAWIYFDLIGNSTPRTGNRTAAMGWWFAHMLLMFCAVLIGVAMTGEVKVHWNEHYPYAYGVLGCLGLAGFIFSLGLIQASTEPRVAHRFTRWRTKIFGIAMAILTLLLLPYMTSFYGNILWGIALMSQIFFPLVRSYFILKKEEGRAENE